jgi:TolB-like protein/Tfp pilus assembly protein PilF
VTEPSHAVFLSYASEDAATAERIATVLRAAGIEVWFDKSELRGGDAWDRRIRRQIRECALFVPVISVHSEARAEGYFRLEWDLADQRTHLMGRNRAFVVPVCPDATPERVADVPDSFLAVQWTRLPGGETPPAFVSRVRRLLSGEASTPIRASVPARERAAASTWSTRVPRAAVVGGIATVLLLVFGFFGLERLWQSRPSLQGESIAVLPLANESGDATEQYFSDGISEDLITMLSQFPGLKVIGRTSSFQFRDSREDSRSIGAKLGVAHLFEGSVRRDGDTVRVSAELINTADGSTQWSERYDRAYRDLFALQDEITRAVAEALRAKLLPGKELAAQSDRPPGGSLEAYNALLLGRFYALRNNEHDTRQAVELYTRATQLDPRYAVAWSGLAEEWAALGYAYLGGAPAQEAYARAREAADHALALSPELASPYLTLGLLLQENDFNWRGAEAEFRRALAVAPNDGQVKFYLGNLVASYGEVDAAIELTRQALTRDPLRANWYNWLAIYLLGQNRLGEAGQAVRKAIELQPTGAQYHGTLTVIEIQRGNAQEALLAAQQEPPGLAQDVALALARQIGSDRSAADAALSQLIEKDADSAAYSIADAYALRNRAKETFAWLDRALSNHDSNIPTILFDPIILRYKDDPRFAALCHKVGLPSPGEVPARKST